MSSSIRASQTLAVGSTKLEEVELQTIQVVEKTSSSSVNGLDKEEEPLNPVEVEEGDKSADNKKMEPFEIAGIAMHQVRKGLIAPFGSFLEDWFYTILVGFLVVSFWRGGWVLLDRMLCGQEDDASLMNGDSFCYLTFPEEFENRNDSMIISFIAGYILLLIGWACLSQGWWNPAEVFDVNLPTKLKIHKAPTRFIIVLMLGWGTICLWRGIWYFNDHNIYPDDLLKSYKASTGYGAALCVLLGSTASMMAPPAIFLMDGPSHLPPPIGVTIITSWRSIALPAKVAREKTDKDPIWLICIDLFLTFGVLPWGVVSFWRGCWMLMDQALWGFTASQSDIHYSILYSVLLGLGSLFIGSDDFAYLFTPEKALKSEMAVKIANGIFGRIRSLILAFGAVNFWRAVWYIWDEFLGKTSAWSAAGSHCLGIVGLAILGCLSCITAPPSTVGVDAVAHPDCADEPLFHNVPVPAEALYLFSIGRSPKVILKTVQAEDEKMPAASELADIVRRSTMKLPIPGEVCVPVDSLLCQDEYVTSNQARTTRFTQQTSALVQSAARNESSSSMRLSQRHMSQRSSNQFFRSR